jgi:hypothetical protein
MKYMITRKNEAGSRNWTEDVFDRAYCRNNGKFERIKTRLNLGFSQLVYLPGSCMEAAAAYVTKQLGEANRWQVFGKHPGKSGGMDAVWNATTDIIQALVRWLGEDAQQPPPDVIFQNLDRLFADGSSHNGLIQDPGARVALFSLIECTRCARTLGLADIAFGKLPDAVETAFYEISWLDEVSPENFEYLIPTELVAKILGRRGNSRDLADNDQLSPGAVWLLASRLRWTDPTRAVRLMRSVAETCANDLAGVLNKVWEVTRAPGFDLPTRIDGAQSADAVGGSYSPDIINTIEARVINPYRRWLGLAEDPGVTEEQVKRTLEKLSPGVVLFGPPGTGKTYLARWIAAQIGVPIRVVAGADLRSSGFGDSERNIVRLLREARRAAPCVLVLDDADDLLTDRSQASGSVAGAERAMVNTMLSQLQGFDGPLAGVLIVVTTNRFNMLDVAVKDRLECHIEVSYPLGEDHVGSLVDVFAKELGLSLDKKVRAGLVERFLKPVYPGPLSLNPATEEARRRARSGLFSPRHIKLAMRMLDNSNDAKSSYSPTAEDVARMEKYFARLATAPELDDQQKKPEGPGAGT